MSDVSAALLFASGRSLVATRQRNPSNSRMVKLVEYELRLPPARCHGMIFAANAGLRSLEPPLESYTHASIIL